jgi:hypothetical protein
LLEQFDKTDYDNDCIEDVARLRKIPNEAHDKQQIDHLDAESNGKDKVANFLRLGKPPRLVVELGSQE